MTSATTAHKDEMASVRSALPELGEAFGERLRSRDPEALEHFFDLYFGFVYGRVRGLVHSTQEAEDLTQGIFLNIHRSLPSFDPESRLKPWVLAIVHRSLRSFDAERRLGPSPFASGGPAPPSIDPGRQEFELERQEGDDRVKRAVYRLPLGVRSVLFLRIYDDLTFNTIAKILGLAPAAVRKRYSEALNLLRKSLPVEGARL